MVNIDTVYQRVLALANKEQRGYITPQDFNLFANQAEWTAQNIQKRAMNKRKKIHDARVAEISSSSGYKKRKTT